MLASASTKLTRSPALSHCLPTTEIRAGRCQTGNETLGASLRPISDKTDGHHPGQTFSTPPKANREPCHRRDAVPRRALPSAVGVDEQCHLRHREDALWHRVLQPTAPLCRSHLHVESDIGATSKLRILTRRLRTDSCGVHAVGCHSRWRMSIGRPALFLASPRARLTCFSISMADPKTRRLSMNLSRQRGMQEMYGHADRTSGLGGETYLALPRLTLRERV